MANQRLDQGERDHDIEDQDADDRGIGARPIGARALGRPERTEGGQEQPYGELERVFRDSSRREFGVELFSEYGTENSDRSCSI